MRGKAFDPSLIILNKRITPAYAGKREFRRVQTLLHQDHPRLCGEKVIPPPELPPVPGSPPPMRGKVPHSFVHHLSTRITPAYAGKSLPKSWRNMTQKGSPPPMRGKEYRRYLRRNERGITPAYAGKSLHDACQIIFSQDHPRLCGEKTRPQYNQFPNTGSPPPMRGKVAPWSGRIPPFQDHPRLCGEKQAVLKPTIKRRGSPPPMRGKVILVCNLMLVFRITPAYAGKSMYAVQSMPRERDHPRLCGEKVENPVPSRIYEGSPPPMRGKASGVKASHKTPGITPAYAGKSTA